MDNWKAIIFLLAAGQGLLLSLALFSPSRNKEKSNIFLGLIIWVMALEILAAWGMQVDYFASKDAIPFYLLGSYLIWPPAVWLFAQLNTIPNFQFKKKHLLLFLPAFVETIVEIGFSIHFRLTGNFFKLLDLKVWYFLTEITPIIWMMVVLLVYGRVVLHYYGQLKAYASPLPSIHLVKLFGLFTFLVLLTFLWAIAEFLQINIYTYINLILAIFLFTLGYIGYWNPTFFNVPKIFQPKSSDVHNFYNYNDQEELERLIQLLEQNHLFTRPKLSLEELAGELKLPARYVSYLINTYHSTNFSNFINAYRVKEVIRKIQDPAEQHKTILALALESGFNSKSTFNQVFKNLTGQSPSEYLVIPKS